MSVPIALPDRWQRAMERAEKDLLRPVKLEEGKYILPSVSGAPGSFHTVRVVGGKIVFCDCPGWRGKDHPCKHAASVCLLLLRERGIVD